MGMGGHGVVLAAGPPLFSPQRGHPLQGGGGLWRWPDPGRDGGTLYEPLGEPGDTPLPSLGRGGGTRHPGCPQAARVLGWDEATGEGAGVLLAAELLAARDPPGMEPGLGGGLVCMGGLYRVPLSPPSRLSARRLREVPGED